MKISEQAYFDSLKQELTENGTLFYVGKLLERASQKFGSTCALIAQDQTYTYDQLYARASAFCTVLKQHGVKPRDRVLICFENSPEFFIAYYAVWQAGAVIAPINTFLKERELAHIIDDARPALIVIASDRIETFKKADGPHLPRILTEHDMPLAHPDIPFEKPIALEPDEMAALLYTSGTTGLPKGVMLSSRNIMTNIMQAVSRLQIGYQEKLFGVLPLFHVFAQMVCVWASVFMGAAVILIPKIERRTILEGLKHKPTGFFGVPALYGLLCLLRTAPLDSVKFFVSGGDAMPDKIRSYFELLYRRKICNGYGLTETSPLISVDFDDIAQPTNSVGKLAIGVEIQVRDEDGKVLPQGQVGELWVKGDNIMLGYYNAPELTAKVLQNGWFNTGDMVYMGADHRLVITGRTKDLIANKGIKIYPQEIENVIMSYPNVIRVGVVGKTDPDGEVPIAFVQLRQQEEGIEEKLRTLCDHQLASYKVPRSFVCSTDELPMTATGKVDKKVLRKLVG